METWIFHPDYPLPIIEKEQDTQSDDDSELSLEVILTVPSKITAQQGNESLDKKRFCVGILKHMRIKLGYQDIINHFPKNSIPTESQVSNSSDSKVK
ncbi:15457_t:CDS:2, partial [Entrophospora sp. SA101]